MASLVTTVTIIGNMPIIHSSFHVNRFHGALIGGLLGGVLKFCGDFIDKDYSYTVTHRKDLGAGTHAKAARSAGIIDSNFHKRLPYYN
jgi:hypothetical protein